ncbi:MAG TPA: NAD(+)/NADH kinase [Acidobacteriota bacterium]|nr:NAD(+)/NADH kinase [Acidobacteriota bacterium]
MKRLGIIVNMQRPEAEPTVTAIKRWADTQGWPVVATERIDLVRKPDDHGIPGGVFDDRVDLLLALGGDGTILTAVRTAAPFGAPVLGINLGTLGFLSAVSSELAVAALDRIRVGDYRIEERLMLQVSERERTGESWSGLNDIVLDKGGIARMARFHVSLNGEFVSQFDGDGLIAATPTGSTAYSLSVGGPILMPTMNAFVLAPISPHTLAQRPMVFADTDHLEVTVSSAAGSVMLTVDGQRTRELEHGTSVEIARSPHSARLIDFSDRSFLKVLREKLHWGIGPAGKT